MPRFLIFCLLPLIVLVGGCSEPEVYKPLIEISNAKLTRPAEDVLRVTLDYELVPEERLPLPLQGNRYFPAGAAGEDSLPPWKNLSCRSIRSSSRSAFPPNPLIGRN